MTGDAGNFKNMETRPVIKIFFPARQSAEGNSRHSDRNIRGTCTIVCHRQKLGGRVKFTKAVSFLHDNAPAHRALQPRRDWPTWASYVLITHPILRIWPRRTTICSLDWKKKTIERSPFFVRCGGHCCRGDLVGRTAFWILFEWLAKGRAAG